MFVFSFFSFLINRYQQRRDWAAPAPLLSARYELLIREYWREALICPVCVCVCVCVRVFGSSGLTLTTISRKEVLADIRCGLLSRPRTASQIGPSTPTLCGSGLCRWAPTHPATHSPRRPSTQSQPARFGDTPLCGPDPCRWEPTHRLTQSPTHIHTYIQTDRQTDVQTDRDR